MITEKQKFYPSVFPDDKPKEINHSAVSARIYTKEDGILLVKESKKAGEHIYQPRTFIEIRVRGSQDTVNRPLQEKDTKRFPDAWASYNGDKVDESTGTSLDKLSNIENGQIVALNSRGIYTLEDLTSIQPEQMTGVFMGMRKLQDEARSILGIEAVNVTAIISEDQRKLQSENDELKARLERIETMMANLAQPQDQEKPPKPKRGRPPRKGADVITNDMPASSA